MKTIVLYGKPVSEKIRLSLEQKILKLKNKDIIPKLSVILVGNDPASEVYVNMKHKTFIKYNCKSDIHKLSENATKDELIDLINKLNNDYKVHGILLQLPLPKHLSSQEIISFICPDKDVDGLHPMNVGKLFLGNPSFIPCTPYGCLKILDFYNIDISGKKVAIIGRSNIVGKPLLSLLSQNFSWGNATVTLCHSRTKNLTKITKSSDLVIVAVGVPHLLKTDMVKEGVHILDVGINRISDKSSKKGYRLVGDVDYKNLLDKAQSITPVPGGIGPLTITMLLNNTVEAASK